MNAIVSSPSRQNAQRAEIAAPAAAEPDQYLTFLLAGEMFAIGILAIKEIIEYRELTVVPMMPPSVRGVLNLRGAVVPVIDLLARFGRPAGVIGKRSCFVVVEIEQEGETQVVGVLVDAVCEVLDIAAADIEPPPSFGMHLRSDFIHGMGKVREKFVVLLDAARVLMLDDSRALVHTADTAPAPAPKDTSAIAA